MILVSIEDYRGCVNAMFQSAIPSPMYCVCYQNCKLNLCNDKVLKRIVAFIFVIVGLWSIDCCDGIPGR